MSKYDDPVAKITLEVEKLNKTCAVVRIGGKVSILLETPNNPESRYELMNCKSFHLWFRNRRPVINGSPSPISKIWLRHEKRRQYDGIASFRKDFEND